MSDDLFNENILALDLATTTGYCIGPPALKPLLWGSLRFGSIGSSRAQVYRHERQWLDHVIEHHRIGLVVFESPATGMMHAGKTTPETQKKLTGLCEHVEEMCHLRVELREANVSQVRAHFIGRTNLKREAAKRAIKDRCHSYGWDVGEDDNAADSCALWSYQVSCLRPDIAAKMTPLFYGKRKIIA